MVYPHIAKVAEAYTAIEDKRVQIFESSAIVRSSNGESIIKEINKVFEEIKTLDIVLSRKKNL